MGDPLDQSPTSGPTAEPHQTCCCSVPPTSPPNSQKFRQCLTFRGRSQAGMDRLNAMPTTLSPTRAESGLPPKHVRASSGNEACNVVLDIGGPEQPKMGLVRASKVLPALGRPEIAPHAKMQLLARISQHLAQSTWSASENPIEVPMGPGRPAGGLLARPLACGECMGRQGEASEGLCRGCPS